MENTSTRSWSIQQLAIFAWFATGIGHLCIRARAGTGKTSTILESIRYIGDAGAKILLCAFNKRIQIELAAKLADPRAEAKTLHALGFAFIRRQWKNVRIDNDVEWDRIQKAAPKAPDAIGALAMKLVDLAKGMKPFGTKAELVELAKDYQLVPEDEWTNEGWDVHAVADIALKAMELSKQQDARGRISFSDMLFIPLVNKMVRPWFNWVIVDEAQDMNYSQLLLAQGACKRGGHIVVVGDDRQAIYGFRGADSGSLDRLKAELKAVELGLTITYRCPKLVVAQAQVLVPDYFAAETAPEGIISTVTEDRIFEAARVGDAVLSRKNAPLMSICLRLLRQGVPARIEGRDVGKALLALVKKMKAKSVPHFLEKIGAWEKKQTDRAIARGKDVESVTQGINDQAETLAAIAVGATSVAEIEDRCNRLFEDTIAPDGTINRRPAVVCSSVHKAKGLEWNRVFILEKTLYCGGKRRDDIEEKNIHYVAVTRAKQELTWVKDALPPAAPAVEAFKTDTATDTAA